MNAVRRSVSIVLVVLSAVAFSVAAAEGPLPTRPGVSPPGAQSGEKVALPDGASQGWWGQVQKDLQQQEYSVTWSDQTPFPGSKGAWQAPNRAQGFETYFTEMGIRVTRQSENVPSWQWGLELSRWGREGALREVVAAQLRVSANRVDLDRGAIGEWYVNDERGLEQGFTIPAPPPDSALSPQSSALSIRSSALGTQSSLHIDLALTGNLHPRFSEDGQAVDFYDGGSIAVLRYASLKVTDATGRVLPSRFEGVPGAIRIAVDDTGALYPVRVDPLATSPAWTVTEGAADHFGYSVATAGDVNGDGYSDVVVGAEAYTSYTGKAYLYLGGPSGLSTTASWSATGEASSNTFGRCVATAGDVNGDGYSDVVIGAEGFSSSTGKAYLYLGSASGLSGTASWTATGQGTNHYFGLSIATAGDVNGDGYSDVVVGASGYSSNTGKAYLYTGGPTGLSGAASWSATGEATANYYGWSVATAGDVNGDGYSEVVVGAYGFGTNAGKGYVYLGGASGLSSTAPWTATGEGTGNNFGYSVATAGDVNGDGYSDLIVGATNYSSNRGKVYVYLGGPAGLSGTASWSAIGETTSSFFGLCVAVAGDVNGDGYSDVLVGASGFSSQTGKAYLYLGGSSGLSSTASWSATGEATTNYYGRSVATAGDVNGDGFSDVVAGAYLYNSFLGKAYLYLGGPSGLSSTSSWSGTGEGTSNYFGCSVATAGDVNGDGYSDVVVGAYGYNGWTGRAYLYLGGASGLSTTASWTATGEAVGINLFGWSVATAGDVNGDGYSDVVVGARGNNVYTGKVYLYLGGASGLSSTASWTATGEGTNQSFGGSLATAGDVNGDGYSDVVVGAYDYGSSAGRTYLYLGSASGLSSTASWTATGEAAGDQFGISVAAAGDVNGDGYSDVVAGACGNNSSRGKAYLYEGSASGLSGTASWTAAGESSNNYFGYAAATAGDVNGDGYSDVIVGAYGYSASAAGKAYLFLGGPSGLSGTTSWTAIGESTNNWFGSSVAAAGDVNGDGFSDAVVGAYGFSSVTGKTYLYLGGASGLSGTAFWTATGGAASDFFGLSVATAGDVNGDGYSDVVVGAYGYTSNTGRAYLFCGDGEAGGGVALRPQQLRADLSAPIAPLGLAYERQFQVGLRLRSPYGRGRVRLEWQVVPLSSNFNPVDNPIQTGSWANSGVTGFNWTQLVTPSWPAGPWKWRARVRYRTASTPFQLFGPWFSIAANAPSETDLRGSLSTLPPTCVVPDEPCWLYSVVKSGTDYTLNFQDPNQSNQRTGWNIRRSNDPSVLPKSSWPLVGTNVVDMDAGAANYQWTDHSGDDPAPSLVWYFQVTTYNANCPAEGPF